MAALSNNFRPVTIKFDLYCEDDDIQFKTELLSLMVSNIRELKGAAYLSYQLNDPVPFQKSVHKVKATVGLLSDPEFTEAIEEMKKKLSNDTPYPSPDELNKFNDLCKSFISSLEKEAQMLQSG